MTEMQEKTRKFRLALVCIGLVTLLGVSIYSAHLLLHKPYLFVQEEHQPVVLPTTPAPTYRTPTITRSPHRTTTYRPTTTTYHHTVSPTTMRSTAPMRIHQTSSATVHSVGGGNGGAFGISTTGSTTTRGILTTNSAYTGMIYMVTPHNAVTSVGAGYAEEVVNEKMGIVSRRAKAGDGWSEENDGPVLDPPVLTPVGDVAWEWMILLVAAYATMCGVRRFRREER